MSNPRVFISYSHDSPEHSARVLEFSNALRSHGIDAELDQYIVRPEHGWPRWCEEQLRPENSDFVLMVCTEIFLNRVENKVAADEGLGVFWEGGIIYDYIYDTKGNTRFIPILFADGKPEFIPRPLRNHTQYQIGSFELADVGYHRLYRELTDQPASPKPDLGQVIEMGASEPTAAMPLKAREARTNFPTMDISRIFKYVPSKLLGREPELEILDDAWAKVQSEEHPRPHILSFVALGGEGKTSLMAKWAAHLADKGWPGCDSVFAWSFYSQGTREQIAASSDVFLAQALTFFGNETMAKSAAGQFEKGRELARIIRERRVLLILDGIEPLQYSPSSPTAGQLKDQGIAALLKGLAVVNRGLCLVTTRYAVKDLAAFRSSGAPEHELPRLPTAAGVALLRALGVKIGSEQEFETLVEDVDGHALTLQIIGGFLARACRGDIRRRDRIDLRKADAKIQNGHAFRAMAAYEKWLADESEESRRELTVLRLLGLFDRPATADSIDALRRSPAIEGLTEPLMDLSDEDWEFSLTALEDAKLVTVNRIDASGELLGLDSHPLLREYFARRVREEQPDAWRAAHGRLFEHLCRTAPISTRFSERELLMANFGIVSDAPEPSFEELQPVFQAVSHGCQADLHEQVYNEVLINRICRGNQFYCTRMLGAFGSYLGVLACFFEAHWRRVSSRISKQEKSWLLGEAALALRAVGRLAEALEPMKAGLKNSLSDEKWEHLSRLACNLSELELTLGEILEAEQYAQQAVKFSDLSDDEFEKFDNRTLHAEIFHQLGRQAEAKALFQDAEEMQAADQPPFPLLYSLRGFRYCNLLLADAEQSAWQVILGLPHTIDTGSLEQAVGDVSRRAEQTLEWTENNRGSLLSIAFDHLIWGRAALYAMMLNIAPTLSIAQGDLDAGMTRLRQAGAVEFLAHGLLTRAWLRQTEGQLTGADSAQADLDEAWEIAERGPMKLHMADIHLYRARLFFREEVYPWESPAADLEAAEKLINECGYHRRDEELADAKKAILKE